MTLNDLGWPWITSSFYQKPKHDVVCKSVTSAAEKHAWEKFTDHILHDVDNYKHKYTVFINVDICTLHPSLYKASRKYQIYQQHGKNDPNIFGSLWKSK